MTILKSQDTYTKLFWIYTAVMMLIATPLALVLVFVKLFSVRAKKNADFRPAPGSPLGARTTARSAAAIGLNQASKKMRRRTLVGAVLSVACLGTMVLCAMNGISLRIIFFCTFSSAFYLFTGLNALFSLSRFRDYAAAMAAVPSMTVAQLAQTTGLAEKQIRQDMVNLEFMDMLPGAVFDRGQDLIFLL